MNQKSTIVILIILAGVIWYSTNHIKWPIALDRGWSPPVLVTSTENGFHGGGDLYKWHDTLILINQQQHWLPHSSICSDSTCSVTIRNNDSSNSWTKLTPIQAPGYYAFHCPAFDQADDRIMFGGGFIEDNELHISAMFIRMTADNRIRIETERKWARTQESLFGKTGTNVTINEPIKRASQSKRKYPYLGGGVIGGSEMYVPFLLDATTFIPPNTYSRGPFYSGVFHSTDFGVTWQMEQVSASDAFDPSVFATKANCYYFANGGVGTKRERALWFSRKPIGDGSWDTPKPLTKTTPNGVDEHYSAMTEDDTIHVCWLDNRHEIKYWFGLARSGRGNYEVGYRRRKDSDVSWRNDVILSKGVMFAFSPCISVERDKVAVAWAGALTAHAWPFEGDPSDIYYATSKDGGKTWSKPLKVTDQAKDGITSGSAKVAVQNGAIHLFYAQGKFDRNTQVWNQGSWPVYYQQRPFPN